MFSSNMNKSQTDLKLILKKNLMFNKSITENMFKSTFIKLSKQKKNEMPDIYNLKRNLPIDSINKYYKYK